MTVLKPADATYAALKLVPEGTRATLYTNQQGRARTNVAAELLKEPDNGGLHDWQITGRPVTADTSLLMPD